MLIINTQRKIRVTDSFTIDINKTKHLKEVKDHYNDYFRTTKKEMEDDAGICKNFSCSCHVRMNKIATILKALYRFGAIPIKRPVTLFTEIGGKKITWKHKMPYIVKTTLSKKILIFLNHGNKKKKKKKHGTELRKDL